MSSCQSYSTFSSENFSVSDGEEGNTSDHSHSGTPDGLSNNNEEHMEDKLEDMLSHTPEIPIEISTQSDGLSDKESAVRRVKTQISLGKLCAEEHCHEVSFLQRLIVATLSSRGLHWQIHLGDLIITESEYTAQKVTITV